MDLLRQLQEQERKDRAFWGNVSKQIIEGMKNRLSEPRVGLFEAPASFALPDDDPGGMDFDMSPGDTAGLGRPQAIKSGSGAENLGRGRPEIPIKGDIVVSPGVGIVKRIDDTTDQAVRGKGFAASKADLTPLEPQHISDVVVQLGKFGNEKAAALVKAGETLVWVLPSLGKETPRRFSYVGKAPKDDSLGGATLVDK